ncbi:N-acetyl-gamma-glutamyl-phosphate reductase [Bordetella genomosp. 4]|uniref:N-acetyl-gamma-glutamyl-phosphate reductase n=1 Tax=Bordetella genomosp. 4 TaxID=463044 RepID=UPI000B9E6CAF|nr:N-acetyl-gamma-glutamyl-phosphate reductase [Bordetella genomosp. 4]OZI50395.1 N-acetyl-gamma-glutamyl-phosphate reductase [Bordetella genomosp. 4]
MTIPHVFIDGDQGTTGLQIHARLQGRDDIVIDTLPTAYRKDPQRRAEALNACDIAILCLPDAAAREAVALVKNPDVRIIDASSAHRVQDGWTYGFPELSADQSRLIAQSKRVTNPGCYPTGAVGLLSPLVTAGLLPSDYPLAIHAVSGYSGGGRAAVERYEGVDPHSAGSSGSQQSSSLPAFQIYGLPLQHKHVPEIQRYAGLALPPAFVPAYGSYRQGIVLTIALHQRLLPASVNAGTLHACLADHYAGAQYVRVLPQAESSALQALDPRRLNDTNNMELAVFSNREHGQILLAAVFDNLGKGASGAAVQNLDLMLESVQ